MSDFVTKKSLGQNFLTSDIVPKWMCDAAQVKKGETVLEIGPGTGVLTHELLARGAQVIAVEADKRAIDSLQERFPKELEDEQLVVHHADARELNPSALGLKNGTYKAVANIPYYLSGLLFRSLLSSDTQPNTIVFLVQKEVAKRIASQVERGEKESLLSLSVKVYGDPSYIKTVGRGHFAPPPQVDSGIIAIYNINKERLSGIDEEYFFNLLHMGFGQKRKQLLGNLSAQYDREKLINIFSTVGLPPTIRAEDVPLSNWLRLASILKTIEN